MNLRRLIPLGLTLVLAVLLAGHVATAVGQSAPAGPTPSSPAKAAPRSSSARTPRPTARP